MFQQESVTNVHALLGEIDNFLEGTPANETERVDWERFSDRKKRALSSLDLLYRMFGQFDAPRSCSGGKPEPKPNRLNMIYSCSSSKPEPKQSHLAVTYGCTEQKPSPKNSRLNLTEIKEDS